MSDRMRGLSFQELCRYASKWKKGFFCVNSDQYYRPDPFHRIAYRGDTLDTPVGVAAGPHTQLSQNIITAWLCGARYIELKTIQVLDELAVSKPCIDMEDEGFNCEWSQELTLTEAFHEYLNAWIICHYLAEQFNGDGPGFVFNFSVGYDLKGIMSEKVQSFLDRIENAGDYIRAKQKSVAEDYPEIASVRVPERISKSVTLSTMHGCLPEEIEKIGRYLIGKRKLDTTIKLNPTLLGEKRIREILNKNMDYPVKVPKQAFAHDLKYDQAVEIIKKLKKCAEKSDVHFGVKLSNTLECENRRNIFSKKEKTVYMSGRALHPVTVNLAYELRKSFSGDLDISFSGGADCFNISKLLECGLFPVTVCSDILKPGGYTRLPQYMEKISSYFGKTGPEEYLKNNDIGKTLENLEKYAFEVCGDVYYQKNRYISKNIKIERKLPVFDCARAPCMTACPAGQDVPAYMHFTAAKDYDNAASVICETNPMPNTTAMICDHVCRYKCTRQNIDDALHIRMIKRFIISNAELPPVKAGSTPAGKKAAVIGAGPSGLGCSLALRKYGWDVDCYEAEKDAGGIVRHVIPGFRMDEKHLDTDIKRAEKAGVHFIFSYKTGRKELDSFKKKYDAVYLAAGAGMDRFLGIKGEDTQNVIGALDFLGRLKKDEHFRINGNVCIIGGGNSAMDAARAALRITDGKVHIVYRRTVLEMPADREEFLAAIEEGAVLNELYSPLAIRKGKKGLMLECGKMRPGPAGKDGRRSPVPVKNKSRTFLCTAVISAIGQQSDPELVKGTYSPDKQNYKQGDILSGGDALRGPSSIIRAAADGRDAARTIAGVSETVNKPGGLVKLKKHSAILACKTFSEPVNEEIRGEDGFIIPGRGYTEKQAVKEASRCLQCSDICNICVSVCPNRALQYVSSIDDPLKVYKYDSHKGEFTVHSEMKLDQQYQILKIADFCNECGNCTAFCPSSEAPYTKKAAICLCSESYDLEERGYFVSRDEIRWKSPEESAILWKEKGKYIYTDGKFTAEYSIKSFTPITVNGIDKDAVLDKPSVMLMIFKLAKKLV